MAGKLAISVITLSFLMDRRCELGRAPMADSTCFRGCTGRGETRGSLFFFRQLEISAPPRCFLSISVTDPDHVTDCESCFWVLWDAADGRRQGYAYERFRPRDS